MELVINLPMFVNIEPVFQFSSALKKGFEDLNVVIRGVSRLHSSDERCHFGAELENRLDLLGIELRDKRAYPVANFYQTGKGQSLKSLSDRRSTDTEFCRNIILPKHMPGSILQRANPIPQQIVNIRG